MRSTAMCWGFECGDGWEPIIRRLSEKLEKLILAIPEELREGCGASQVKEKLGTLRFYLWGSTDEMEDAVEAAEEESAKTCEECGEPGRLIHINDSIWLKTLCTKCESTDLKS